MSRVPTAAQTASGPPRGGVRPDLGAAAPIAVAGVHKSFGSTQVLRGADLPVDAGHLVALLGPSGCGKTTLLRAIAGLERPDAGTVAVGGKTVSGDGVFVPPERRRVGMVFQDWALFPHLRVARNVGYGLSRPERRSGRVEQALALVELSGLGERMPSTLSGGQQQRVALARALAHRPTAILLDEPFSNLDTALRIQIRTEVRGLLSDLGITTLFVTHDQEEALLLGDEVAVLLDGRVVQQATPAQVYSAPATRAVATFVGDANLVPGVARGACADTSVGVVALREDRRGPVDVLVRPEELRVRTGDTAVVEAVEYYGHDAVYRVRPDHGAVRVRARVIAAPRFRSGDRVTVDYVGAPTVGYTRAGS